MWLLPVPSCEDGERGEFEACRCPSTSCAADLTLAVSQQLADWVLRRQAERPPPPEYAHLPAVDRRVVSFYVGVNVAAWWQSGPTPTAAAASVVQVCRLSSNKRPVLGVRAMAAGVQRAAVSAGQPPVPVEVVGDGALEPEVTAATGSAPVPVTLHGSLQPQEVRSVVERAETPEPTLTLPVGPMTSTAS